MIGALTLSALLYVVAALVIPWPWNMLASLAAFFFILLGVIFSALTVKIEKSQLVWYFGPGLWTYRLPLKTLRNAKPVKNPWWYGWGIRRTPAGWLYNVSGLSAVEIRQADKTAVRIGSSEPKHLTAAIKKAIK